MTTILIGGLIGLLVGVTVHLGSHYFEGRMDHADGLAYHMLENTATGVFIAAAALGLAAVARYGAQWMSGSIKARMFFGRSR